MKANKVFERGNFRGFCFYGKLQDKYVHIRTHGYTYGYKHIKDIENSLSFFLPLLKCSLFSQPLA